MRVSRVVATAVAVLVVCFAAVAQEKPGSAAAVYSVKPRSSGWGQLEEAMRNHFAWHRSQNDTFAYHVWQVMSGDNVGDFVVGTFGHNWKEFDGRKELDHADVADFVANVIPLTEEMSLHYVAMVPEASRPSARAQPPAMSQVTLYFVKPSGVVQFADALKEIKATLDKANYPIRSSWYRLVSAGEGPHYVLVVERNTFAELEPLSKSLEQVIAEVTSPAKAIELASAVLDNTRHTYSELLVYRADLSYAPGR